MRQIVALLVPALAWADNTVPPRNWRDACAARLRRAQGDAAKLDARFARGRAEGYVDEDVLPLREHARFELDVTEPNNSFQYGFWVEIGPADSKSAASEWHDARNGRGFPYGAMRHRARTLGRRTADVTQKMPEGPTAPVEMVEKLQLLWETAADDCLRMK